MRLPDLVARPSVLSLLPLLALVLPAPARAGDGALDPGFGTGGVLQVAFDLGGADNDYATAVVGDADDGALFVVGYGSAPTSEHDWEIAKITGSGVPQTGGSVTKVTKAFDLGGSGSDRAKAAVYDGHGGLVVAGTAENTSSQDLRICRFRTIDLGLDAAFGNDAGCEDYALAGSSFDVAGIVNAGDGGFVVGGSIDQQGDLGLYALELGPTGLVDTSFASSGLRVVQRNRVAAGSDFATAITIGSGGDIVLAGGEQGSGSDVYKLYVELSPSGGLVRVRDYPDSGTTRWAESIALDPRSDLYGSGWHDDQADTAALATLWPDESEVFFPTQDVTWSSGQENHPTRVLLPSDGKPIVAGYYDNGSHGAVLAATRFLFLGFGPADASWGASGAATFSPFDAGYGIGTSTGAATAWGGGPVVMAAESDGNVGEEDWLIVKLASALTFDDAFETGDLRMWGGTSP